MTEDNSSTTLRYVEFYAGIGGWTMALEEACKKINDSRLLNQMFGGSNEKYVPHFLKTDCLAAFDHSEVCIDVWEHNFSHKKTKKDLSLKSKKSRKRRKSGQSPSLSTTMDKVEKKEQQIEIQRISQKQLETYNAHIWVMSPPCQPHTRQHENQEKEFNDPRSQSFLHLCSMISIMAKDKLPSLIFLENVIGFEKSKSFKVWRETLLERGYTVSHFHLTPYQVDLPNDRPRYYCTAILKNKKIDAGKAKATGALNHLIYDRLLSSLSLESKSGNFQTQIFLDKNPTMNTSIPALDVKENCNVEFGNISPISNFLDQSNDSDPALKIPSKLLKKNAAWCFDILVPSDNRSSCFTHGYGRFIRGTGSILYIGKSIPNASPAKKQESTTKMSESSAFDRFKLVSPKERLFDSNWYEGLDLENDFRYFSGIEMARMMGFPVDNEDKDISRFSFPDNCTMRNQWRLIGNSLNSRLASKVVETGLLLLLLPHDEKKDTIDLKNNTND